MILKMILEFILKIKSIFIIKKNATKVKKRKEQNIYYKEKKGGKDRIVLTNGEVAVGTVQDYADIILK